MYTFAPAKDIEKMASLKGLNLQNGDHDIEDDDWDECEGHEGPLPIVGLVHGRHHVGEDEYPDYTNLKIEFLVNFLRSNGHWKFFF